MGSKKIQLNRGASAAEALRVARGALEDRGYRWVQTGDTRAEAHEGGAEITKKHDTRLRVDLEVDGSDLVLKQGTHGGGGFAAGLGPLTAMGVTSKFKKARHSVEDALKSAGLA
ncbi:hypothetical protein V5P93_004392 [Actinokineospora auranticolor]|uniref:Uncharacterized protein n=1 Tax=Actinokineospora auranticolor TaxID=155976 RepID=A0A2S6GTQ1_9PSEU|nr:hypothetical protein [Actinokineospora auranticolor]PPK68501.1 hypothetical protein CLV40_105230 [Actinokineospora auranticolor]